MNGLFILVFSIAWLVFAYFWYGKRKIQNGLISPLDAKKTPSHEKFDGNDYYPAPKMVLFGHHFSSIAGAGPIVGPIVAVAAFGWGPAVLWLLVAGVFIGAVHDYLSLMISVRNNGASIPDTADRFVSRRARTLFLIFVWLTIILVIAVFGNFAAKAMIHKPELVLPTFLMIPLAIVFGVINKKGLLPLKVNTVLALAGLVFLIWLGFTFPITFDLAPKTVYIIWFSLLMLYGFVASVTPVWILLQPRDYISSFVLIIGVALAFLGIFVVRPEMNAPVMTSFMNPKAGPMIPFLFIVIACGAVSGFHSIIAGGTSSKQLDREKDALPVAFGGMLVETIIGILCVIIAGGAIVWGSGEGGLHNLLSHGSPIGVFGAGFGKLTGFVFGSKLGALIGVTIVNLFIMTTLDTSVRLGRFLTGEMVGEKVPTIKNNKFILTVIPIIPAFLLGISDAWTKVWPVFGSANQLVAAFVFIIATAYLYANGKKIRYTLWATVFMLITTVVALGWLAWKYFVVNPDPLLGSLSVVLIVLALMMIGEGIKLVTRIKTANKPAPSGQEG